MTVLRALGRLVWPQSLRGRLIAVLLLALLVAQVLSLVFFFDERRLAVRAALAEEAVSRAASVALLIEQSPPNLHDGVLIAASTPLSRFRLDERSLAPPPSAREASRRPARPARRRLVDALGEMTGADWSGRVRSAVLVVGPHRNAEGWFGRPPPHRLRLTLSVALSNGQWLNVESRFRRPPLQWAWPSIMSMALMAVAIIGLVSLVAGRLTRSLRALGDAADRFGRGARGETLPETGPIEARRLTAAFNAMQERLTRFVADRTRLLASISHDLRTPITAMRLRVELLDDGEAKDKLASALDEMERMTEASLSFAREEAADEPMRSVDLQALAESVVEDSVDLGRQAEIAPGPRLPIDARPTALTRALRNLVENAVRYGERARVTLAPVGDAIEIHVDDDGPGLPPDRIEEMFEPFVRLEASRSRDTGGVGLGLSIARSIARAHGGDVVLVNRSGGGLRAMLRLPK